MGYYINIDDGKINGGSELDNSRFATETSFQIEVSKELYEDCMNEPLKYIYSNGSIVSNPNYETDKQIERKARIMELTMTPLDFLKALNKIGISYATVKQIMEDNPEVDMEMRYCQNVYRKHPMIDQFASQFGITSEQIDELFIQANGGEI